MTLPKAREAAPLPFTNIRPPEKSDQSCSREAQEQGMPRKLATVARVPFPPPRLALRATFISEQDLPGATNWWWEGPEAKMGRATNEKLGD